MFFPGRPHAQGRVRSCHRRFRPPSRVRARCPGLDGATAGGYRAVVIFQASVSKLARFAREPCRSGHPTPQHLPDPAKHLRRFRRRFEAEPSLTSTTGGMAFRMAGSLASGSLPKRREIFSASLEHGLRLRQPTVGGQTTASLGRKAAEMPMAPSSKPGSLRRSGVPEALDLGSSLNSFSTLAAKVFHSPGPGTG